MLFFLDVQSRNDWRPVEAFRAVAVRNSVSFGRQGLNECETNPTSIIWPCSFDQMILADSFHNGIRVCSVLGNELMDKFMVFGSFFSGAWVRALRESVSITVLFTSPIQQLE